MSQLTNKIHCFFLETKALLFFCPLFAVLYFLQIYFFSWVLVCLFPIVIVHQIFYIQVLSKTRQSIQSNIFVVIYN